MHELLAYVDIIVHRGELNVEWLEEMLRKSPCFLINTHLDLGNVCNFLGRAYAARGNLQKEKLLYSNFAASPHSSLDADDHKQQSRCLDVLMKVCVGTTVGTYGVVCARLQALQL